MPTTMMTPTRGGCHTLAGDQRAADGGGASAAGDQAAEQLAELLLHGLGSVGLAGASAFEAVVDDPGADGVRPAEGGLGGREVHGGDHRPLDQADDGCGGRFPLVTEADLAELQQRQNVAITIDRAVMMLV
ncbi:hypothetical protein, partial [Streptomyces marianii]|uniref:hypothetical protein n=1 Tax=Streptomyces marianii TaxID=1817406 RepID=UPI001F2264B9